MPCFRRDGSRVLDHALALAGGTRTVRDPRARSSMTVSTSRSGALRATAVTLRPDVPSRSERLQSRLLSDDRRRAAGRSAVGRYSSRLAPDQRLSVLRTVQVARGPSPAELDPRVVFLNTPRSIIMRTSPPPRRAARPRSGPGCRCTRSGGPGSHGIMPRRHRAEVLVGQAGRRIDGSILSARPPTVALAISGRASAIR